MTEVPSTPKHATTVSSGTLIMGTYEIERLINSGGMGEVYRGRNIHNGEPVAIKIVLPSLAHDPKIVALFQKESTVLSRLSHEAIVRYHVFTVDPTIGRPCMVMEFVSGTAMSDRIEQGPMPLEDVKVMLRRVASGLDKAHRAGVVHRDLSPDNVILEDGHVEHAKLIDFGIAKSTALGAGTLLQGQFAGKFNWVSPEQLGAFGGVVDGRSDIYSLALVTAAASRGAVLPMGASIVDAVGQRAKVPDLTGVDQALQPLLAWMLQPDPAARPASMAAVMAAVDNPNLVPQPVEPEPKPVDPNRTVIGGALPIPEPRAASVPPAPVMLHSTPPVPLQQAATVITATLKPEPEPDDLSPFGAPAAPVLSAPLVQPPVAKSGKGGLVAVLALLALGGGTAGVYFSGMLDQKPVPAGGETQADAEARVKADAEAAARQAEAAAAEAAKQAQAAKQAEAEAAAKAAAEAEAAATAKVAAEAEAARQAEAAAAAQKAADEAAAQMAADEAAAAKQAKADAAAKKAADDAAAVQKAADEAAAQKAADAAAAQKASKEAAAQKAADEAAAAQKAADEAAAQKAADEAAARKAADAAAAQKAAEEAAAKKAADDAAAQKAADDAAKTAAETALRADPVGTQLGYLAAYKAPACTLLRVRDTKADGFALDGFSADPASLGDLAEAWKSATLTTPQIAQHQINATQCPVLDFANRYAASDIDPLSVILSTISETVKSGTTITGKVEGLEGRSFTLFLFSEAGGATNLKPWITLGADGSVSFEFVPSLNPGAPPAPQLLAVIATDEPIASLDKVPTGVTAESLVPFLDKQLAEIGVKPTLGFGFFRLEN